MTDGWRAGESTGAELISYYSRRAAEYERIYARPERQADLASLRRSLSEELRGRDVLGIACGTGYWTERVAPQARSIVAVDRSEAVLEVARRKHYPAGRVELHSGDAYRLDAIPGEFDALLSTFWWSHIPRDRLPAFLRSIRERFPDGTRCVAVDNRYVEGNSTPLSETDAGGNTFQLRRLDDGSEYRVLKNFAEPDELLGQVEPFARNARCECSQYFWMLSWELA